MNVCERSCRKTGKIGCGKTCSGASVDLCINHCVQEREVNNGCLAKSTARDDRARARKLRAAEAAKRAAERSARRAARRLRREAAKAKRDRCSRKIHAKKRRALRKRLQALEAAAMRCAEDDNACVDKNYHAIAALKRSRGDRSTQ